MARDRIHGEDKEFMEWCRSHPDLPSFSRECGWVQTDVDTLIHRYMTTFDGQGTRELQCLMLIEVKTRSGMPSPSQEDTLRKQHLCTKTEIRINGQTVKNFGVTVVTMDGTTPEDSHSIEWCRFEQHPPHALNRTVVTVQQFVELIRFDRHPDTLITQPFRRHHATRTVIERTVTPLGWIDEQLVVHRS
jgi:hypothetical protein